MSSPSIESDTLEIDNHIIIGGSLVCSPNCNERPDDSKPSLIVIHCISLPAGQFGGPYISDLFLNQLDCTQDPSFDPLKGLRVSAHTLIRRCGEIIQFVPFDKRAWHAGASCFMGRENCNDFSIGIELEGTEDSPFTDIQYQQLTRLLTALHHCYPATVENGLVAHSDIAPERKTDPGPHFDWDRLAKKGFERSDWVNIRADG